MLAKLPDLAVTTMTVVLRTQTPHSANVLFEKRRIRISSRRIVIYIV